MPRPRFQRADPALQQAILDAAVRELGEHGYEGASLNRMLLAAGLSKGAFYYYFDDKADLAAAVLERELARWNLTDLQLGNSAAEFWAELERYLLKSLDQLHEAPASRDVITRLGITLMRDPELRDRLGPLMAETQRHLGGVWQRGQELGAVRTDIPIATLIALAQNTKLTLGEAMLPTDRAATDGELEQFTRVYFDMLRRMTEPVNPPTKEARRR